MVSGIFVQTRHPHRHYLIHWWPFGSDHPLCGRRPVHKARRVIEEPWKLEYFSCKNCLLSVRALERKSERRS